MSRKFSDSPFKKDLTILQKGFEEETPEETNRTNFQQIISPNSEQKFFAHSKGIQKSPITKNLNLNGDLMQVSPETPRKHEERKQRFDKFGQIILKGSKTHNISFRDLVSNNKIKDIIFIKPNKQTEEDQNLCCCCCCLIQ